MMMMMMVVMMMVVVVVAVVLGGTGFRILYMQTPDRPPQRLLLVTFDKPLGRPKTLKNYFKIQDFQNSKSIFSKSFTKPGAIIDTNPGIKI